MTEEVRHVYSSFTEDLAWYREKLVFASYGYGHISMFTPKGEFVDSVEEYSPAGKEVKVIGKVIKPRWNRFRRGWVDCGYVSRKDAP